MFSKNSKPNTIRVASSDAPNDFQEVEVGNAMLLIPIPIKKNQTFFLILKIIAQLC